jgi:hypothetical protein
MSSVPANVPPYLLTFVIDSEPPASPSRVLSRRIKHPLEVTVQRSNDVDAREHRWIVMFCNQQKRRIAACHSASCSAYGLITSASGTFRTWRDVLHESAMRAKADIYQARHGRVQPSSSRGFTALL